MGRPLSVSTRAKLTSVLRHGASLAHAGAPPPQELIRLTRQALRMTQAQLARRAGMPQSLVARIERGRGDVRLGTLRRLFDALGLDLVTGAAPRRPLEAVLEERVRAAARRRVERVAATMALERQEPGADFLRALEREEAARLRGGRGSEIWDE